MFKLKQINLNKIKEILPRLPKILAEHFCVSLSGLFVLSLIIGCFLFYRYYILVQKREADLSENGVYLEQKTVKDVLRAWDDRQEKFERAAAKQYLNPFQDKIEPLTEEPSHLPFVPEAKPAAQTQKKNLEAPDEKVKQLLAAFTLADFYRIKGEHLPSPDERAKFWQTKGLGPAEEYWASQEQNMILLQAFKEELAQ